MSAVGETTGTTYWRCTCCNAKGEVQYDSHATVYQVVYLIRDDHAAKSPMCVFDIATVRVCREPFSSRAPAPGGE